MKREVMEETGLNAKIGDIVSINEGKSTQMNVHTLFIMFKATIKNEVIDIQMKDEISETKWMTIEEADQNLTYYNHSLKVFLNNKATYYNEGVID
ncbi:NADH pyrophosphatase NudC (nudix superfamily) [Staphylococcus hominis]